ncbi:MAG TPA: NAD(P)H-hydrate epimerase, partial [Burkholderiaceae bacterium]|nr:NAD(P)H-hydrate epimerase [Burkholderiaceae bacterium]
MRPVLPITLEQPLHDAAQTRAIERAASAALPAHTLMRRAGNSVARLARALAPNARSFWIAAGPGNNGGDGLEAALQLRAAGYDVEVSLLANAEALPADAADAFARAQAAGVTLSTAPSPGATHGFAIDALLGVGAARAPAGAIAAAIDALNAFDARVLAIDLPSGLHADTGRPLGAACVCAANTLALLTLKPGLFTAAGRDQAGRVWFDDLGVEPSSAEPIAWLSGSARPAAPARRHLQHKGSFGDVTVVGGAPGMAGAALLAARAAHAAGAGRVYVKLLDTSAAAIALDSTRPELMFREAHGATREALAHGTIVAGCGGGEAVRPHLARLLGGAHRLVLDADALNAIALDTSLATLLRARAARGRATVLTPHPLEAARLLGIATADVQADRLHAAAALAARFECSVVLKGSGSVIAAPGATPRINATGNA